MSIPAEKPNTPSLFKECTLNYQTEISPGIYVMTLDAGDMASATLPGQFVMVKCWNGSEPFLMRPISVNTVDRKSGTMTLLYAVTQCRRKYAGDWSGWFIFPCLS